MKKTVLTFGLISGALSVAMMLATESVRQPADQRGSHVRPTVPDRSRRRSDLGGDPAEAP
jgi:hypothetical protein